MGIKEVWIITWQLQVGLRPVDMGKLEKNWEQENESLNSKLIMDVGKDLFL